VIHIVCRPGGKDLPVKWEEKDDYRSAVLNYRLNEFRVQVEHIRKGMATIVPIHLLSLFTWNELQLNVCGKGEIDIEFLKVLGRVVCIMALTSM
jgi:hypothetical protein